MRSKTLLVGGLMLLAAGTAEPSTGGNEAPRPTGNHEIDEYNREYLKLTRSLMSPKHVADAFGRRIGERYIALQLTVANRNSEYQWLVTDAAVDLTRLVHHMNERCPERADSLAALLRDAGSAVANPTISGADLTVLRGVAEKGQQHDPRNVVLRVIQSSGTVAASLLGVTTFGPAFAPSVAAFNGPFASAFQRMFPDETTNQLHRLNDTAYTANTLVPKQQAKVLVVFIPAALLLTHEEQARFYKDPNSIYRDSCTDLRLIDGVVGGHFIAEVDAAAAITAVSIPEIEAASFANDDFKVSGKILGRFLAGASLALADAPAGLQIAPAGDATDTEIPFALTSERPLMPHTPFKIEVRKPGGRPASYPVVATYSPGRPRIAADGIQPASITAGEKSIVEITGSGFLPDAEIDLSNSTGLTVGDIEYVSTSKLKVEIVTAVQIDSGPRELRVRTAGGSSGRSAFRVSSN